MSESKTPINTTFSTVKTGNIVNTTDAKSLDDSEEVMFYFISDEDSNKIFQITEKQAHISGLFKKILDNEHNEKSSVTNPVVLKIIPHPDESFYGKEVHYNINTVSLLEYVMEYFNLWSDDITGSDYCVEGTVQSGDPNHYLKANDIDYIEKFIKTWKHNVNEFDEKKYETDLNYQRITKIRTLSQLISQVDNFLDIESLSKKLYIYTACIVWNTSIVDIAEVEADPEFAKLQEDAVALWRLQNPEKAAHYTSSVTTGDGKENDNILTDLIEDDD